MAAITDEALEVEWFYLEGEEPLDRGNPEFFILQYGKVRSTTKAGLRGSYFITDDAAVLAFSAYERPLFVLKLKASGESFDSRSTSLDASAGYVFEEFDEPIIHYGTFVRRFADYVSSADVAHRIR